MSAISLRIASIFALGLLVTACSGLIGGTDVTYSRYNDPGDARAQSASSDMGTLTYRAVDELLAASRPTLDPASGVLIATPADLDDLDRTSTLGRVIGEVSASRVAQMGYKIHELRLRGALLVQPQTGELILSRELSELSRQYQAQAVMTGTYGVGGKRIYVSLRLVSLNDGRVLSAIDYVMPLDKDTRQLVAESKDAS